MVIHDKVVLITGASEGIGRACAVALRRKGAKLALCSLPCEDLEKMAGDQIMVLAGDVTDARARETFIEQSLKRFGRIDILMNNAAVGLYAPPSAAPLDLGRRLFEVNVFGPLGLAQLVIPIMRRQRTGMIVSIGSVGGAVSLPWAVMYCASKFALHAISDSLRRELRRDGIHVLKVCPGIVQTNFRDHVLAGSAPPEVARIRRVASAERVAQATVRGIEREARTIYVPHMARLFTWVEFFAPGVMDRYLESKT